MGSEVAVAAMARMRSSEVRLKTIALMGQPCLTPDGMGMAAVSMKDMGKPIWARL